MSENVGTERGRGGKQISVCLTWLIIRTENTYSNVCYLYRKTRMGIDAHRYEEGLHKMLGYDFIPLHLCFALAVFSFALAFSGA